MCVPTITASGTRASRKHSLRPRQRRFARRLASFSVIAGAICDARFSKSCGGITERYATAWEDEDIPYLESVYDGPAQPCSYNAETWICSSPPAYCNTHDLELLSRVLPGFDQETRDFYRWRVAYTPEELADLVRSRLAVDLGPIRDLQALARGPSGRIYRLKITGERDYIIIGKELEIRRALSRTHLYSSAFVVDKESGRFVLSGAGWGHGVGLCQIGAAVMANEGNDLHRNPAALLSWDHRQCLMFAPHVGPSAE